MATTNTIPTIVNRYPELFVSRPRIRYAAGDTLVHTDHHPICENKACDCWPALLGDIAWKIQGNVAPSTAHERALKAPLHSNLPFNLMR
jgi:hypothetical protein